MQAQREGRGFILLIIKLAIRWMLVVKFTFRPLYPRERTLVGPEQEAGWAPGPLWAIWRRQKSVFCQNSNPEFRLTYIIKRMIFVTAV